MTHLENARKHAKELLDQAMLDQYKTFHRTIGPATFHVEYIGNDVLEWWVDRGNVSGAEFGLAAAQNADQEFATFIAKHAYGTRKPLTSAEVTSITTSDELEEWL